LKPHFCGCPSRPIAATGEFVPPCSGGDSESHAFRGWRYVFRLSEVKLPRADHRIGRGRCGRSLRPSCNRALNKQNCDKYREKCASVAAICAIHARRRSAQNQCIRCLIAGPRFNFPAPKCPYAPQ
jgi:hypothetical protein